MLGNNRRPKSSAGLLLVLMAAVIGFGCRSGYATDERVTRREANRAAARQLIATALKDAPLMSDGTENAVDGTTEAQNRVSAYCLIAEAQVAVGDKAGARQSLKAASKAASKLDAGDYKVYAECRIVAAQINAGNLANARERLESAKTSAAHIDDNDSDLRGAACHAIIEAQLKTGDIPGAKATVAKLSDENDRPGEYCDIVTAQLKAGDISGAKATAAAIDYQHNRWWAYDAVAEAQANAGDVIGGAATASQISSDFLSFKASAFSKVAAAQAKTGDWKAARSSFEVAQDAASKENDPLEKVWAYGRIAASQTQADDTVGSRESLAAAKKAAALVEGQDAQVADYWVIIAQSQASAGDTVGARELFGLAESVASKMSDEGDKALAYADIADAQAWARDMTGARKNVEAAKKAAALPTNWADNEWIYGAIAKAEAKTGDATGAIAYSAREIRDPWKRCSWIAEAAKELCAAP